MRQRMKSIFPFVIAAASGCKTHIILGGNLEHSLVEATSSSGTAGGGGDGGPPANGGGGGSNNAAVGAVSWANHFGDDAVQVAMDLAVDSVGNSIVTGYFSGSIDFGGNPLSGTDDLFLAKLDPSGHPIWSKSFGDSAAQSGDNVCVDEVGNIFVAGHFSGTLKWTTIPPLTTDSTPRLFLAKFSPEGEPVWSVASSGSGTSDLRGLVVTKSGDPVIVGKFPGDFHIGSKDFTSHGDQDIFLAKFTGDGSPVFAKQFGDLDQQIVESIALDVNDNILLAGSFRGNLDMDGTSTSTQGDLAADTANDDLFISKLDSSGHHLWSRQWGNAPASQLASAITTDTSNNVIAAGIFWGTMDVEGKSIDGGPASAGLLMKLNSDGKMLWNQVVGDPDAGEWLVDLATDQDDNILLTGSMWGSMPLGNTVLTSGGDNDAYVVKFDPSGLPVWGRRAGDASQQFGKAVACDPSGNVIAAGFFAGTLDWGPAPQVCTGQADVYVVRFSP